MAIKKRKPVRAVVEEVAEEVVEEVTEDVVEEVEAVEEVKPVKKDKETNSKKEGKKTMTLEEKKNYGVQLEEELKELLGTDDDFVKIKELASILKTILATEGLDASLTSSTRMVSAYNTFLLSLLTNGKRFSLGNKQFRKGHNDTRVFKAREGFSEHDTLQFAHDTMGIYLKIDGFEPNVKGKYDEETDTFTTLDGEEYKVSEL